MGDEAHPAEGVTGVTEGREMVFGAQGEPGVLRFRPLNDVVFSCVFDDVEQTGQAMLEFLNALLASVGDDAIDEIVEMRSRYSLIPVRPALDPGRIAVRARGTSGAIYDVVVRLTRDAMYEHECFCGPTVAGKELRAGTTDEDLPRAVLVDLCDFHIREGGTEIVESLRLRCARGEREIASHELKVFRVQLPVFRKKYKTLASVSGDRLLQWLYLFDKGYLSEEETEMLAQSSEGMRRFADRYGTAIMDPVLVDRYNAYVEASHEEASRRIVAERRAEARGEARGRYEQNRANARGMREKGMSPEDISDITGLSIEEIVAL